MFTVTDAGALFSLTDAAATKVKDLMASEAETEGLVLRVAVRPGGCSGFTYEMFFDTDVTADDDVSEWAGIKVAIDPASAPHLRGGSLDYRDGLQGAGFAINNPNAERSCGCGQSFSYRTRQSRLRPRSGGVVARPGRPTMRSYPEP